MLLAQRIEKKMLKTELDKVLGFVRRAMNRGESPPEWVTMFRLVLAGKYESKEDDTGEVETIVVRQPGHKKVLKTPDQVTAEIQEHVDGQTQSIGGKVKFRLLAYAGEGNRKPCVQTAITHFHQEPEEGDESELEPTPRGRTKQDMVHVERLMTIAEGAISDTQRVLRADNDAMREHMGTIMGKFVALVPVIESLMTQAHVRKLADEEHGAKMKLLNEIGERALTMLPHLVNWYFKMPVMQGQQSPAELAIRETLASIKGEQFFAIMAQLNEVQRAPLLAIYSQMVKEDEDKKAKASEQLSTAIPSRMIPQTVTKSAAE